MVLRDDLPTAPAPLFASEEVPNALKEDDDPEAPEAPELDEDKDEDEEEEDVDDEIDEPEEDFEDLDMDDANTVTMTLGMSLDARVIRSTTRMTSPRTRSAFGSCA